MSQGYPLASGRRQLRSAAALPTWLDVAEPGACVFHWDGLEGPNLEGRKVPNLCTLEGCATRVGSVPLGHTTLPP